MKTIKIIDLLNKIANGEEVPEKIFYKSQWWKYNPINDYEGAGYGGCLLNNVCLDELNDEVEIVEEKGPEEKQIKKLDWFDTNGVGDEDDAYYLRVNGKEHYIDSEYDSYGMTLILKINELIDAVNESRKENK